MGYHDEYILVLLKIGEAIERKHPDLKVFIACRNDIDKRLLCDRVVPYHQFDPDDYGYIRHIMDNKEKHPLLEIIKESGVVPDPSIHKSEPIGNCVILSKGPSYLTSLQCLKLEEIAKDKGYSVSYNTGIDEASWVIGMECLDLYMAGMAGKRTTLVLGGVGAEVYNMVLGNGEVIKL